MEIEGEGLYFFLSDGGMGKEDWRSGWRVKMKGRKEREED